MSITLLLAEDHKLMRQGLLALIEKQPEMTVLGEAEDGETAVRLASKLSPQVVVMDVSMPGIGGIEATRRILSENSGVKIIGLSAHQDKRFVMAMLQAGALGYLLKDCAFEEVIDAIKSVAAGRVYLSPGSSGVLVQDLLAHVPVNNASARAGLTERERNVLVFLADGKNTKEIAGALEVSVKTVEADRQRVMKKLQLSNMVELTKFALREGLASLAPESVLPNN